MPLIIFEEATKNISIKKYIDYELLFFIDDKQFSAWDFYIINYLFSYKIFRATIDRILSKNVINTIKGTQVKNVYISMDKEKVYSLNHHKGKLTYLCTQNQINLINEISSLKIKVSVPNFNNNAKYRIHFNFIEMMKISKCTSLLSSSKNR